MYSTLKKVLLKITPKQILFKYEYTLRYFYYLIYAGKQFQCNLCEKKLSKFIQLRNHKICPRCGSINRNRRLWLILNNGLLHSNTKILDFSPSRSLYRLMKKNPNYISSDISGDFLANVSYDITNIEANNDSFDLIICYHILEHVIDDFKAINELFRVLSTNGTCLIQTPFKEGEIYEDFSIVTPEDREKHFGQFDHVRIYSIDGLKQRLKDAGFFVKDAKFEEAPLNVFGLSPKETILICTKPS